MTSVSTTQIVFTAQSPRTTNRNGLLSHARVKRATNASLLVQVTDGFLEFADDVHLPVSNGKFGNRDGHEVLLFIGWKDESVSSIGGFHWKVGFSRPGSMVVGIACKTGL